MRFPLFDRQEERSCLLRLISQAVGSLGVLYGRRRCGKSRLLREVLPRDRTVYYVGDDREASLQRAALAKEIGWLLVGFDRVEYPDWEALFDRFWSSAPAGTVLVLDELPALVSQSSEIPSLLQKWIDSQTERGIHLLVAGSSQRMMQGLVLDRGVPLYGRAREILKIRPLRPGWIVDALAPGKPEMAVEAYSFWGGVPRYWELAADHASSHQALRDLVLSPLGRLYEEPLRILRDGLRDTAQASSILSLIGVGCSRPSEIAARLGKPASSMSRPLGRLLEMELIGREVPFGESPRRSKKVLYRIADPFLRTWFRFVEPNRSRLEARLVDLVMAGLEERLRHHAAETWEELARESVPLLALHGETWGPAGRWWGSGLDRRPLELDVVAESLDGDALLVGKVQRSAIERPEAELARLAHKVETLPLASGRQVHCALWCLGAGDDAEGDEVVGPGRVLAAMR